MKDTYVLQPEAAANKKDETQKDWMVIRRRKAPDQTVADTPRSKGSTEVETPAQSVPKPVESVDSRPPVLPEADLGDVDPSDCTHYDALWKETATDAQPAVAPQADRPVAEAPVEGEDNPVEGVVTPETDLPHRAEDPAPDAAVEPDMDAQAPTEITPEPAAPVAPEAVEDTKVISETQEIAASQEAPAQQVEAEPQEDAPAAATEAAPVLALTDRVDAQDDTTDIWPQLRSVHIGARHDGKPVRQKAPALVEYFRADPIAKGFDLLRTRLVRTIRAYGWRRVAVVAPTPGCGATFTAVNLALSLSRVPGSRTVLMDMNQRAPGVSDALGLRKTADLDGFLRAETSVDEYILRYGDTLALGLGAGPSDFAAEMLHDPLTGEVLDDMIEALNPDLVIYDLPPMLSHDDLAAFLPQVDGVLLVADGTQTVPEHLSACERILDGQTQLLGVVLNRARSEAGADLAV